MGNWHKSAIQHLVGNWPLLSVQKIFYLLIFFGHVLTNLAWTKCRLVTKHVLTFPLKIIFIQNFQLSNKVYFVLPYLFLGKILFWRNIHLSFQSHQMCTFSAGLVMARNRHGLSCFKGHEKNQGTSCQAILS